MKSLTKEELDEHLKYKVVGEHASDLNVRLQVFFDKMPRHTSSDPLTSFLYLLMRDHLPAGVVVGLIVQSTNKEESIYTNGHLAQFAELCADEMKRSSLVDRD